jgi:AraC family transcriptional activator of pobA
MRHTRRILHFDDINQSHEAMGSPVRTDLHDFHIFTLQQTYPSTRKIMPPYSLRFYCLMLLEDNSHDAIVELNAERLAGPSNTISFQSPGHVSAWVRGEAQQGFILYFQPEFLTRYSTSLTEDFPFFRPTEINMLPLAPEERAALRDHFVRLERSFKGSHSYRVSMLQVLLLALLYDCQGLYESYCSLQPQHPPVKFALAAQFQQLIEQHYLTHRSVQTYADLLHVTPNHLSQTISNTLGRKAHELIEDRLLLEAKKLLRYTSLSVAEVAEYLGFEEPTHFTRLFKRRFALTPLQYRRCVQPIT